MDRDVGEYRDIALHYRPDLAELRYPVSSGSKREDSNGRTNIEAAAFPNDS